MKYLLIISVGFLLLVSCDGCILDPSPFANGDIPVCGNNVTVQLYDSIVFWKVVP